MKMQKHVKLRNFLTRAPICMIQKPNESISEGKKLFNYMCYTKYGYISEVMQYVTM